MVTKSEFEFVYRYTIDFGEGYILLFPYLDYDDGIYWSLESVYVGRRTYIDRAWIE